MMRRLQLKSLSKEVIEVAAVQPVRIQKLIDSRNEIEKKDLNPDKGRAFSG
jgi:hypothetical protein